MISRFERTKDKTHKIGSKTKSIFKKTCAEIASTFNVYSASYYERKERYEAQAIASAEHRYRVHLSRETSRSLHTSKRLLKRIKKKLEAEIEHWTQQTESYRNSAEEKRKAQEVKELTQTALVICMLAMQTMDSVRRLVDGQVPMVNSVHEHQVGAEQLADDFAKLLGDVELLVREDISRRGRREGSLDSAERYVPGALRVVNRSS